MVRKILLTLVVLSGFMAVPRSAMAGCTTDLADCYGRASRVDSFWYRAASRAGLRARVHRLRAAQDHRPLTRSSRRPASAHLGAGRRKVRKADAMPLMKTRASALGTMIWCAAAASCTTRPSGSLAVRPIYGPVIGSEVIAGRAEDLDARQPVVLLVGDSALVAIDLVCAHGHSPIDESSAGHQLLGAGPAARRIALDAEGPAHARPGAGRRADRAGSPRSTPRSSGCSGKAIACCISRPTSSRRRRRCSPAGPATRCASRGAPYAREPLRSRVRPSRRSTWCRAAPRLAPNVRAGFPTSPRFTWWTKRAARAGSSWEASIASRPRCC